MWQKILLPVGVFLAILVALTYGEAVGHFALAWFTWLTGLAIDNFGELYQLARDYIGSHTGKILIALVLTAPISYWLLKSRLESGQTISPRKIAIILALFLGWLGAHRFYLGQVAWGIVYLVIFIIYAPLAVVLGLIDAARYLFMSDDDLPKN